MSWAGRALSTTPLGAARERERGQVLVLFAFVLIALLLVSALAVDYGGWLLARRSYQNVADEAAIAGAYLLTSDVSSTCPIGGISKQQCARQAAWTSIKAHTGLTTLNPVTQAVSIGNTAYTEAGYRIWVASPPSDAGSAYPGFSSSTKTIFVRVERDLSANLSRVIRSSTTVGAWATAGRIPKNFAIIVLCGPPTCTPPNGDNTKVNGTGSNLILETGDLGSNSFGKTAGNSASIALGPTSSAYMHYPAQCAIGSGSCLIDSWTSGGGVNPAVQYSALALPQVVDPQYKQPGCAATSTDCTPSSAYVPYQCYSTSDTPPAITMGSDPVADGTDLNGVPIDLAGAALPPTEPPLLLGAATATGRVTAAVGGAALNGITMTLTGPSNPAPVLTKKTGGVDGVYTINGVTPAGAYTLTASDATNVYRTKSVAVTITASGTVTTNMTLNKNPAFTGTLTDSVTSGSITTGAVSATGPGGTFNATMVGNVYTVYVTGLASAYTLTATAPGYSSLSYGDTSGAVDSSVTQNFSMNPSPGTIQGTVTGTGGVALVGASLAISGVGTITSGAGGAYSTGASAGSHTITVSYTGYNPQTVTVTVPNGGTVTQNFQLVAAATITGTITDDTTGLPLAGATVAIASGSPTGNSPVTTNSSGVYTITGLQNGNYRVTASLAGYTSNTSANTSVSGTTTINLSLWPARCGTNNNTKGKWDCGYGTGGCPTVTNAASATVSCSAFDNTNRIRPGTYKDITIANGQCAWIDPLGGTPGLTSGQKAGIVYVTDNISIGSGAFLFGDGVTIVVSKDASVDVNNSGGFVLNYYDSANTYNGSNWRTASYIGGAGVSFCSGDSDSLADLRKGAWTTKTRYVWDQSVTPPCYDDQGSAASTYKGEIGMTWFLRGTPPNSNSHRFDLSGLMGFLFDGVLYGPKDDIGLGGQGQQASAGQIVAWTITYSGNTDIHQRYSGIEVDGPPYLIEPYVGE